jgi:hypothetical protein
MWENERIPVKGCSEEAHHTNDGPYQVCPCEAGSAKLTWHEWGDSGNTVATSVIRVKDGRAGEKALGVG